MRLYRLETSNWLPRPLDEVFAFHADAGNLQRITPPWLDFAIRTPAPVEMRKGTLIDYRLRLHGIPLRWQSAITFWDPPRSFVDEQRRGPYRRWIHRHEFVEEHGGTRVGDEVEYAVPFGALANWLVVERDVRRIFAYRREALCRIFGVEPCEPVSIVIGPTHRAC